MDNGWNDQQGHPNPAEQHETIPVAHHETVPLQPPVQPVDTAAQQPEVQPAADAWWLAEQPAAPAKPEPAADAWWIPAAVAAEPASVPPIAAGTGEVPPPPPGYVTVPPAAAPQPRQWHPALLVGAGAMAAVLLMGVGAGGEYLFQLSRDHTSTASSQLPQFNPGTGNGSTGNGSSGSGSSGSGNTNPFGNGNSNPFGNGNVDPFGNGNTDPFGSGNSNGSSTSGLSSATSAQQVGVVDIDTDLALQGGQAAGTGMILTSNGEVLTNNHVIKGATSIKVTVVATGKTYTATVIGYSAKKDVAVLQLQNASNLQTIRYNTSLPSIGDSVVGVGNAGGVGGTPSAAAGKVVALDQTITASSEDGSDANQLSGLIQTDAPIRAGDSGGPLFNTSNQVIGMDTAASTGNTASEGYAIPMATALSVATQIVNHQSSSTVHIGPTAFLGVSIQDTSNGAQILSVVTGSPAAKAGLGKLDTITNFGGYSITGASSLITSVQHFAPGTKVKVTYIDTTGTTHTTTVTLVAGPAQ